MGFFALCSCYFDLPLHVNADSVIHAEFFFFVFLKLHCGTVKRFMYNFFLKITKKHNLIVTKFDLMLLIAVGLAHNLLPLSAFV